MYFITLLVSALFSRSRLRIWYRETDSAVPSRVSFFHFFIFSFSQILSYVFYHTACFSTSFSFAPENFVSRDDFGSPLPRQPAHLHTQSESGVYVRDSSRVPLRRPIIYFNCHTPSSHSRVCRVTQLRTDVVHCREYAGTGTANLKLPHEIGSTRVIKTIYRFSSCAYLRLKLLGDAWSQIHGTSDQILG